MRGSAGATMTGRRRLPVSLVGAGLSAAAVAAPLLSNAGFSLAAVMLTLFFSPICHQDPARSFWLFGGPIAACARCLGMYLGAAAGAWLRAPQSVLLPVVIVAGTLNALDVFTEAVGLHGNWLASRFAFGLLLGGSLGALVGNWAARYSER
jgi:uncharacterized membrane protein